MKTFEWLPTLVENAIGWSKSKYIARIIVYKSLENNCEYRKVELKFYFFERKVKLRKNFEFFSQ